MKNPTINDALWDCIHILSAIANRPLHRSEQEALETIVKMCLAAGKLISEDRGGRALTLPECAVLTRLTAATFSTIGPSEQADTPPQGIKIR